MKTKILKLMNEMSSDSKSESFKAEKELCKILTDIVQKRNAFESKLHINYEEYPDEIYNIDNDIIYYAKLGILPDEIWCNDNDFKFRIEWIDFDYKEFFEIEKRNEINYIKGLIERVESSLREHRDNLNYFQNLTYEDFLKEINQKI